MSDSLQFFDLNNNQCLEKRDNNFHFSSSSNYPTLAMHIRRRIITEQSHLELKVVFKSVYLPRRNNGGDYVCVVCTIKTSQNIIDDTCF